MVGSWSHSDTYNGNDAVGGNFSATTRHFLEIGADGSYAYGSRGMTAGLDNNLGAVSGGAGGGVAMPNSFSRIMRFTRPRSLAWIRYR